MRYVCGMALCVAGVLLLLIPCAYAQNVNPNGFPSGPHFNLNIIGKKAEFACPAQEYDLNGNPIYGNVVFVPDNGSGSLTMQSGRVGKKASTFTELRAIDPCAGFDGTPALIELPPNTNGYRVYARALGKPGDATAISIIPSLVSASDEFGDPLVYLGLVTSGGIFKSDGETITRTGRKSTAMPITDMFLWSGTVCTPYGESPTEICVRDTDADGLVDDVALAVQGVCPAVTPPYTLITSYCNTYVDTWVFNIADFVEYLWSLDNSGTKLVNVRFYPN